MLKLYSDLGSWWPLFSEVEAYEEEAAFFREIFERFAPHARSMLELGCGGGNNASFLKNKYEMTLTDLSPEMLEVSRRLNRSANTLLVTCARFDWGEPSTPYSSTTRSCT